MKDNKFTKKQLKETYSYKHLRNKLIGNSILGLLLSIPYLVGIIYILRDGSRSTAAPLVLLESVMVLIFIGLVAYHAYNFKNLIKYPATYTKYTGKVVGYEMESRSRGRHGSRLVVIFKIMFTTEKGVDTVKSFEFPMEDKICDPDKIKELSFNIAYDEIYDRLCMCDDVRDILCKEGIIDDPMYNL